MLRSVGPLALVTCLSGVATGCDNDSRARSFIVPHSTRPDELPALVTGAMPFKYPASLYARKVQGNVLLTLFVDRDGRVVPESTRVYSTSGFAELDTAAVSGSRELRFVPAKLHGEPIAMPVVFPVFFRHPEAPPFPDDSLPRAMKRG